MNDLLEAARTARANAYAPYSGFRVGAALRAASGRVFAGANVENAAFPQGQCAEANAIAAMVTAGETRIAEALLLAGGAALCTPCGGCRQKLAEFAGPEVPVHLFGDDGHRRTVALGDLLPLSFAAATFADGSPGSPPADAPAVIRERLPEARALVGLVLGSGLGGLADALEEPESFGYEDLPGFPRPSVAGHAGRLVLGRLAGVPVACLQGRVHLYEGLPASAVRPLVATLAGLGCGMLLLTNAAGSLRAEIGPGALVLIDDHINLQGNNPLVGAGSPEFVDLTTVYDAELRQHLAAAAAAEGVELARGVYLATLGPCFETPAEIRAFRALGADLVGMSTVPEAIAARALGMKVAAISVVTNLAAGMAAAGLSHDETLAVAGEAGERLARLVRRFVEGLADGTS